MGCDIHSHAEKRIDGKWTSVPLLPFDWRDYGMYAFLAGIRNYSAITPISTPRGLPDDASPEVRSDSESWDSAGHSHSWLSVAELVGYDYDQTIEDRRCTRKVAAGYISGAETCEAGEGEKMPLRAFLGDSFFEDLKKLQDAGAERIIFWFDN